MNFANKAYRALLLFLSFLWFFCASTIATVFILLSGLVLPSKKHAHLRCAVQALFIAPFIFMYERHNNMRLCMSGDAIEPNESAFVLPNHLNHDWAPLYSVAVRLNMLGGIRCILKKSVRFVPGFGWAMLAMDWCFLSRNWKTDQAYLKEKMNRYRQEGLPLQIWMFPEGTRREPKKMAAAKVFAKERGLQQLEHCLQPRTKGFVAIAQDLKGVCDYVYDVTLAYDGWKFGKREGPGPADLMFMDPPDKMHTFHFHCRKVAVSDLPTDPKELEKWCFDMFQRKDKLMDHYYKNGSFPDSKQAGTVDPSVWYPGIILYSLAILCSFWSIWKLSCSF